MWNDAECGNQAAACGCAVVLWCCCCCGGVQGGGGNIREMDISICRDQSRCHHDVMASWCKEWLPAGVCSVAMCSLKPVFCPRLSLMTAALCAAAATAQRNSPTVVSTTNRHYQPIDSYKRVFRSVKRLHCKLYRQVCTHKKVNDATLASLDIICYLLYIIYIILP